MTYDIDRIRAGFPSLRSGTAHFDSPGGSQTPQVVADAVAGTLTASISNRGQTTASERAADEVVVNARRAMADLLAADPGGIVFGRSATALTYDMSRTLSADWQPGDEIVVTRLDHDANVRPWVQAAERAGVTVRWAPFDRGSGELPPDSVAGLLGPRTRLVAVTGASNLLGTCPDLPAIAGAVHDVGALLFVDGVHLTPHAVVDVDALGADLYVCSPYKFYGPHLGVLSAEPALLEGLRPDKLLPSSDAVPERFELGTLPYELLAGTTAAVDFLAELVPGAGTRRERLVRSLTEAIAHESGLFARLLEGLRATPAVSVFGDPPRRTPTVLFRVDGIASAEVYRRLAALGVNAPASHFYAIEASRWLGLGDDGGVRAGLACYSNQDDVDRLLAGVAEISRSA